MNNIKKEDVTKCYEIKQLADTYGLDYGLVHSYGCRVCHRMECEHTALMYRLLKDVGSLNTVILVVGAPKSLARFYRK